MNAPFTTNVVERSDAAVLLARPLTSDEDETVDNETTAVLFGIGIESKTNGFSSIFHSLQTICDEIDAKFDRFFFRNSNQTLPIDRFWA